MIDMGLSGIIATLVSNFDFVSNGVIPIDYPFQADVPYALQPLSYEVVGGYTQMANGGVHCCCSLT